MRDETFIATACSGKHAYPSPQTAHSALRRMKKLAAQRHRGSIRAKHQCVYRCEVCGSWHIGGAQRNAKR